ncbi:hypothetical protein [Muricoccus aerilatus]|uniref:hypothetical protein n=1 Tax=Muricoccus aerilatus TaxID=452982 RepID=UPI000AF4BE93|nr:hypothetical protein [Roseomonas aerilata]
MLPGVPGSNAGRDIIAAAKTVLTYVVAVIDINWRIAGIVMQADLLADEMDEPFTEVR